VLGSDAVVTAIAAEIAALLATVPLIVLRIGRTRSRRDRPAVLPERGSHYSPAEDEAAVRSHMIAFVAGRLFDPRAC
jgi:hypothetical protein